MNIKSNEITNKQQHILTQC